MERISILFTIPNFITAGSGRAMLNIIERLDPARFTAGVCVSRKGGDLDKVVDQLGIPFIEAPFSLQPKPYVTLPLRAWKAARIFKPHRFQVWHSFNYTDDYTEPIIGRMAGARAWVYAKKNMGWGSRAWQLRTRFATRIAVQNSDMMRNFFDTPSFRPKARKVPRGVDCSKFRPGAAPELGIRSKYNIAADAVVVTCVAQLVPVKGHPTLLQAMTAAPGVQLLIAGNPQDKEYTTALHQQVAQLGLGDRVHFLGNIKNVPALLAESDAFVLPTWAKWRMEGCPVALLEAMACGRPCVATDIPGSRDLVEHERSGLIVKAEDAVALSSALRQLAASPDLRNQLGAAARQRVLDHFTIEKEVAAHEMLYNEIFGLN